MQKYEYKTRFVDYREDFEQDQNMLNSLGKEGWELVSVIGPVTVHRISQIVYYLKRPVSS